MGEKGLKLPTHLGQARGVKYKVKKVIEPRLLVHNYRKECVEQMMMGVRTLPCGVGRVGRWSDSDGARGWSGQGRNRAFQALHACMCYTSWGL